MHSIFSHQIFDFKLITVLSNVAEIGHYINRERMYCELVYKIDGRSRQFFDDVTIDLIPDSIYFIPKFKLNSYTVTEPGTIVNIKFDIVGDFPFDQIKPELITLPSDNKYKNQFISASKIWSEKGPSAYFRCHAVISSIIADLIDDREQSYLQSTKYTRIAPAVEYMRKNFRSPIRISELNQMCGISDEYFRKLFRGFTGQTPLEYINNLRLTYARDILLNGDISIAKAALESGFENVNYFTRIYKKRFGFPPSRDGKIEFVSPYRKDKNHE